MLASDRSTQVMQPFYWPAAAVCDSPTPDQAAASAAVTTVTQTYNKQEFCANKISEDKRCFYQR